MFRIAYHFIFLFKILKPCTYILNAREIVKNFNTTLVGMRTNISKIRGVFGKYVDKCNRMRIKYTRRMKFFINEYQLLNAKSYQYEKLTLINDLDIGN